MSKRTRFHVVLAGVLGVAASALAQEAPPATEPEPSGGVEEIIVTSTKREENIQDVPLAVTALSALQVERAGIKDLRDLPTLSPSFNMNSSQTESQGTTLRIRGVGTTGNNIGLESAVGVFLDGVYLSRPGIALGDLVDVQQIEVLRGPQGTLFGRNTSAGALNIKTKKPDLSEPEYWANATVGNLGTYGVQAGVSAPIVAERLGFRFSGAWRTQDGLVKSTTGAESNTRDRYSLRGQLYWAINDDLDIRFIGDYGKAEEECCDAPITFETPLVAAGAYAAAGLPANAGVTVSGHGAVKDRDSNAEQFENPYEQWGISAELNWDLGPASVVYLLAYRDFNAESVQHSDFVSLDVFSVPGNTGFNSFDDITTFSQEFRVQGELDRLDWMVGIYWSQEEIEELGTLQLGSDFSEYISGSGWWGAITPLAGSALDAIPLPLGGTFGAARLSPDAARAFADGVDPAGSFAANRYRQNSDGWSIFTHNTFHVTDKFDATVGLRWIDEEKHGSYNQVAASNQACTNTIANAAVIPSAAVRGIAVGFMCFPFAVVADQPGSPAGTFDDIFSDEELAYTFALAYAFLEDVNAYASYSHGFKAGGFNLDATAAGGGANPSFLSETTDAYEIGVKTLLFDGRVRGNLAVFHMEMEDFQVLEFTGVRFQTFNVAKAKSTGFEVELVANLLEGLDLSASVTWADARYPGSCGGNGAVPAQVASLCGNDLTNAPEWASVLGASYEDDLPWGGLSYFVNGSMRIESDRRTSTQAVDPTSRVRSVDDIQENNEKVNLRAGLSGEEGHWTVEMWAMNVFDKQTKNVTFNTPLRGISAVGTSSRGVFIEQPRMYGATVRVAF